MRRKTFRYSSHSSSPGKFREQVTDPILYFKMFLKRISKWFIKSLRDHQCQRELSAVTNEKHMGRYIA